MQADQPLDNMTHEQIRDWLGRALHGLEGLPLAEPEEPPHLAVDRLSKCVKPTTRESLRDGCLALVRQFSEDGSGDPAYLMELLRLATQFRAMEIIPPLADLARRFSRMNLPADVRLAVLATLVDTPPPQAPGFWREILDQDPRLYAGRALSGMLATDHAAAIQLLAALPDDEALAQATSRKVAFAWLEMTPKQRGPFVEGIREILESCGPLLDAALKAWIRTKEKADVAIAANGYASAKKSALADAIAALLGEDRTPRFTETKLVQDDSRRAA